MADFETDVIDIPDQVDPNKKPTSTTTGQTGGGSEAITDNDLNASTTKNSSYELAKEGYYYESEEFKKADGGKFKYKAQILRLKDGAGNTLNAFRITGYENGKAFTRTYQMGSGNKADGKYTFVVQPFAGIKNDANGNSTLIFSSSGSLSFVVKNSGGSESKIDFALKAKYPVKDNSTETTDKTAQ